MIYKAEVHDAIFVEAETEQQAVEKLSRGEYTAKGSAAPTRIVESSEEELAEFKAMQN